MAWDVAQQDPAIAADLVSRACLRERISRGRRQTLILHANNRNAMRAATLDSRLEELGVLRSFSRPRVSNDNPYTESLFRTTNTGRTTRDGLLPARMRPSSGWRDLRIGSTSDTSTAASSSSHLINATTAGSRDLPAPCCRLRGSASTEPTLLVRVNPLLASTGGGLDQSAAR